MGPKRPIEEVVLAYAYLIIPIHTDGGCIRRFFLVWSNGCKPDPGCRSTATWQCQLSPSRVPGNNSIYGTSLKTKTELPKEGVGKMICWWALAMAHCFYRTSTELMTWWTRWALAFLRCPRSRLVTQIDTESQPVQWRIPDLLQAHDASSSNNNFGLFSRWAMQRRAGELLGKTSIRRQSPVSFFLYSSSFKTG